MHSPTSHPSVWLHRLSIALFVCVCPLVFVGAGVTSKGAGMAFPDWPTSDGRLLNPPGWLRVNAKLWEHGHRLIGWMVGLLAIAVVVAAWRADAPVVRGRSPARRHRLAILASAVLLVICVQGVLGGLRVRMASTPLAMVHGFWGQICLSLAALLAFRTSPSWPAEPTKSTSCDALLRPGAVRAGLLTTGLILVQLILGVVRRHTGQGLIWHVIVAVVVASLAFWLAVWTLSDPSIRDSLRRLAQALAAAVVGQLILGLAAYLVTGVGGESFGATLHWLVPSAHVLMGALLLATSAALTVGLREHAGESSVQPSLETAVA